MAGNKELNLLSYLVEDGGDLKYPLQGKKLFIEFSSLTDLKAESQSLKKID